MSSAEFGDSISCRLRNMPRPKPEGSIGAEERLAFRIEQERRSRGWGYETLAAEMTAIGCPMNGSACFRIEKGAPRRRITVDELVALSHLWAIPVDRLLS
jgi:hypothetical protein